MTRRTAQEKIEIENACWACVFDLGVPCSSAPAIGRPQGDNSDNMRKLLAAASIIIMRKAVGAQVTGPRPDKVRV